MNIYWTELAILLCLFVGNLLFGNLPFLLVKFVSFFSNREDEWNKKVKLSTFLLYAGAGVFISDSFVVLLPKTSHEFTKTAYHSHEHIGMYILLTKIYASIFQNNRKVKFLLIGLLHLKSLKNQILEVAFK